ncbi:hypothetical protein QBC32DRAFT_347701 [Pseudoneurospora amorphoporcata]|uniref:Uncharacterized protein n=1 Tax=Pseudoneurospora amorphoporcata TaxID=241081 RepID=A0AAN6NQ67_9PEZI|nr:hypothetical protein QBC32DRAFT_347701 [Pseudoneurospora amorphoporcata]
MDTAALARDKTRCIWLIFFLFLVQLIRLHIHGREMHRLFCCTVACCSLLLLVCWAATMYRYCNL